MDEIKDGSLSEELNRLHAEHHRYTQRLDELVQKPYLSVEEQLEEVRLKKLKLHAKDLIYTLEHRQAVVA
ncbi:MAG TPA: YdcH family protein [Terracidiphilus sp.]|nr:YdcH family protein [Terracidiphilus sp.]